MKGVLTKSLGVAAIALALGAPVHAQSGYLSIDNLGYTGTVTCYSSVTDAQAHTNATCTTAVPQRDLSLFFLQNNAAAFGPPPNSAIFLTNWYACAPPNTTCNNPNNADPGFVQMYDDDGGSVTSMSTSWDNSRTVFTLAAAGGPTLPGCTSPGDCSRLWNGTSGSSFTGGEYLQWNVNAVLSGFNQATFNSTTGVYESLSDPTSVSGTITGLFADGFGGFEDLDLTINQISYAESIGGESPTVAGANTVTPEPASLVLMATGLGAVGVVVRRRRKQDA